MLRFIFAGIVCGALLLYDGVKKYRLLKKIENTATSNVASAAVGMVELSGKALHLDDIKSPISGKRCAFWRIVAYGKPVLGKRWKAVFNRESGGCFYLEDDTGSITVDLKGAQVEIPVDFKYEGFIPKDDSGLAPEIDNAVLRFIDKLDEADRAAFKREFPCNLRIFEYLIADGDPLYVLGSAEPREGASSSTGHENLVVKKGTDIMYVRDTHEKKMSQEMRSLSKLEIAGGFILSAISVFFLLVIIIGYLESIASG